VEDQSVAVREISQSARFAETIDALVESTGRPRKDVVDEAVTALNEMAAGVGPKASKAWDRLGKWLTRSYVVEADTTRLAELRALGKRQSLVFLPNHRSYLDPLVLRTALAPYGFPPNFILGGINLALWPISTLGQRSGLVFIRRSAKGDPIYPAVMRVWLGYLIGRGQNLEWYFEGGRTRTGKLRPPKMGVLRYLVDAFLAGDRKDDVVFVPVSLVYDQQHEVSALSLEEGGGTKQAETLGQMVQFARAQGRRRGRAHVRFGDPVSLRSMFDDASDRAGSADLQAVVPRVAFEVAHRINDATPITPSALVTFALLDNDGRAMTVTETLELLEPFLDYVRARRLPLTSGVDLGRPEGLSTALATLVREGVVEAYTGGQEPVYSIAANRAHEAGFYRNTVTHYFTTRAMAEVAIALTPAHSGVDPTRHVWVHSLALRDLLKYEFFFADKRDFDADLRREMALADPHWDQVARDADDPKTLLRGAPLLLAHRVIGPFLEAYSVLADLLAAREPAAPVDSEALVTQALGQARQRWLQHELHSPESISKDLMNGAVKLAGNRNLLDAGGEDLRRARQEFADELATACQAVGVIREIARQRMLSKTTTTAQPSDDGSGKEGNDR
jgi:glycerol-3-phosphate O-acyltransferase